MKTYFGVCLILFCMAYHVIAQSPSAPTKPLTALEQTLIGAEQSFVGAAKKGDITFFKRTLADDYVAITPLGQVTTKPETIGARRSGQLRYEAMNITDMVVRVYGDTAVVTARADVKGHQLGEDFSGPYRYTRVWVRRSGRWQTVSYQATVTQ